MRRQPDVIIIEPEFHKRCSGCKEVKAFEAFNANAKARLGRHNHCRACQKITKRRYYLANLEKERRRSALMGKTEQARIARKARYERDKERLLYENRKRRATDRARKKAEAARLAKEARDPSTKIARNLRVRLRRAVNGINRSAAMLRLLGCDLETLKKHLEGQFSDEMSWGNYGYRGWHIDHRRPCSSFDLTDPEQQRACFHYSNLQPLWRVENQSKGAKWVSLKSDNNRPGRAETSQVPVGDGR